MSTRPAVRAGSFYDAQPPACRRHAEELIAAAELPDDLPEQVVGGIVPHAGWMFSGRTAARTLKALVRGEPPETFVLFGADHSGAVACGEVYDAGCWQSPLGEAPVDEALAAAMLATDGPLRANKAAHGHEHSIEVQVPLIQVLAPAAKIVPIAVPPTPEAVAIGRTVAGVIAERSAAACVVGSTDLTHHGGHFGSPGGRGQAGVDWAQANDRRMVALLEQMAADQIVPEADAHKNACGAGAAAAAVAAAGQLGATRGIMLEYTNSYEILAELNPSHADDTTVGYAAVVFA
ncbi:MAG: AmmeMemoRadiSam system protein B [Phycisphaerae bacterium]|nr:AmmeMemoRadiSam system protein B [Phycisphaerae bacterium]